jgi:hypothetical protein
MKPKKLSKKLSINRKTIANLTGLEKKKVLGGKDICTLDFSGCTVDLQKCVTFGGDCSDSVNCLPTKETNCSPCHGITD